MNPLHKSIPGILNSIPSNFEAGLLENLPQDISSYVKNIHKGSIPSSEITISEGMNEVVTDVSIPQVVLFKSLIGVSVTARSGALSKMTGSVANARIRAYLLSSNTLRTICTFYATSEGASPEIPCDISWRVMEFG